MLLHPKKNSRNGLAPSAKSVNYIIGGEYSDVKFECQRLLIRIVNSNARPGEACFSGPSAGEFRVPANCVSSPRIPDELEMAWYGVVMFMLMTLGIVRV